MPLEYAHVICRECNGDIQLVQHCQACNQTGQAQYGTRSARNALAMQEAMDKFGKPLGIVETVRKQTMHNHIEHNGIQIKYGETVLVEVDRLSPLLADRQAYHLNLATLALEQCEQSQEQLPYFVEMTYSAELLSYHNWRNRIMQYLRSVDVPDMLDVVIVCRLHRISYNEFAWIKLEPLNVGDFKATYAVLRKPYEWEQLFGLRVSAENLKGMGMPREEQSMRPINLMEYFQAVGSV